MLSGLIHRGGLRAQILTEGIIRVDDPILDLGEEHIATHEMLEDALSEEEAFA